MEEILDDSRPGKSAPKKVFSILSFIFSVSTLILVTILFVIIVTHFNQNNGYPMKPPVALVSLTQISCISGVVFAIVSMVRKEKLRYIKALGATLNFLLLVLILGLILYAAIIDMNR